MRHLVFLGLAVLTSTAMGQRIPRILNGEPTDQFPSVGAVGSLDLGQEYCTGTLITSRHVLTAAHCAEVLDNNQDATFRLGNVVYRSSLVFIHPDYNTITLENDIAILELSEEVVGVTPSRLFDGTPEEGMLLTIVGFGAGGDGDGSDGLFGTKRVGTTQIDEVTRWTIEWTFDSNDESNTAPGDSGGPNYLMIDDEFFIAGVTSGGTVADAGLGDEAFNTRVDAYLGWVDMIIDSTPDDPEQEDPEQGDPEQGDPEQGDPEQGDPEQGDPEQGDPEQGDPEQGDPEQGDPEQGDPEQGDPEQGDGQQDEADCPPHRPGYRPGNRPGNRPGYRPGNRPGNRPGYRPGNRPGNRPGHYRPGRKPSRKPGYRSPGRRPPSKRPATKRPGNSRRPGSRYPSKGPAGRGRGGNRSQR